MSLSSKTEHPAEFPTEDSEDDMPPVQFNQLSPTAEENHVNIFQSQRSFAFLPPEHLEQICEYVPVQERFRCAAVSLSWRNELLGRSSYWRDLRLGRSANCYPATSSIHVADFLPLSRVKNVKFQAAVPFVMRESFPLGCLFGVEVPMEYQIKEIPFGRLGVILKRELLIEDSFKMSLSTLQLAVDVNQEDLSSPIDIVDGQLNNLSRRSRREFIQMKDSKLVSRLATEWQSKLHMLEEVDVCCRVISDDRYVTRIDVGLQRYAPRDNVVCFFPLLFGSKCDCGKTHIWTDTKVPWVCGT